jgi:hypothetical protein
MVTDKQKHTYMWLYIMKGGVQGAHAARCVIIVVHLNYTVCVIMSGKLKKSKLNNIYFKFQIEFSN